MSRTCLLGFLILISLASPLAASAQEVGNPLRGQARAQELCSECHYTGPGDHLSPEPAAPPFQIIADTGGMTGMALSAWLQTSHPTMPNVMLKPDTADDIISYILTLKKPKAAKPSAH